MKFLDLFAGIGGFRLGMERAGHECIGFCEIDKFARASYKAIHDTKGEIELHDITAVTDDTIRGIGRVDVICGGFPCQAFSVAGKRRGFEDTRGTLFFEIARFASILRPKYLFLENVTGLLNHDNGNTFETILRALDELGYDAEWQVCNSKNFGVAQNRERVFIIGHLRGERTRAIFPFGGEGKDLDFELKLVGLVGGIKRDTGKRIYSQDGVFPTLTTKSHMNDVGKVAIPVLAPDREEKRQNGRRFKENGDPMFTLTSQDRHGVMVESEIKVIGKIEPKIIQRSHGYNQGGQFDTAPTLTSNSWQENNYFLDGYRIRKLTPKECWRLQGFPDWAFDRASKVNSNSQLYKQAGNSVTVNVIEAIARRL